MGCIHCGNIPGEFYTHHLEGKYLCGYCGFELDKENVLELQYRGITSNPDGELVHYYARLHPIHCPECHACHSEGFYRCENDGEVVDFSQLREMVEEWTN